MVVACPRYPWWRLARWAIGIAMSEKSNGLVESGESASRKMGAEMKMGPT